MNRSKLLLIIVCLFLVQSHVAALELGTLQLTPPKKVSPLETNQEMTFLKKFNVLTLALGVYILDAKVRLPKEAIIQRMTDDIALWESNFGIVFDIDNIDFRKKGFTRYYPFNINGKDFIIRFYDAREKCYLPDFEVYYEGIFDKSQIGFQIIPGVNTILEGNKVEKVPFPYPTVCSKNP